MRIEWLTACQRTDRTPEGFPTIQGALVDTSYVQRLGEEIVVVIALVLVEGWVNLHRGRTDYPLQCEVHDPDLNTIVSHEITLTAYIDPATYPEGSDGRILITVLVPFTPTREGMYQFKFALEGGSPALLAHYVEIDREQGAE